MISQEWLSIAQSFQPLIAGVVIGLSLFFGFSLLSKRLNALVANQLRAPVYQQDYPQAQQAGPKSDAHAQGAEFEKHVVLVSQISGMARENAAHVAAVLKSWLHDEHRLRLAGLCIKALGIETAKLVAAQLHSKDMAKLGVIMSDRGITHASESEMREALDELHAALIAYEFMQGNGDWGFLGRLSDEGLTTVIRSEDLSGMALILFHLPASRAARIYGMLDEKTKYNVVESLFKLEKQDAATTQAIAARVKIKAEQILSVPQGAVSGTVSWIAIVGAQLPEKDRRILMNGAHAAADAATVGELKAKLFSFTDIVYLPSETLSGILHAFKPVELAMLAASAPDGSAIVKAIYQALPNQIREVVAEEAPLQRQLLTRPHTRQKGIHDMRLLRTRFEEIVKEMHARGELSLADIISDSVRAA